MLTGADYISSLDDGRLTYFDGRHVPDLLAEPAFETPIRAIAAGYDRHYSPEPGATNPLVVAPRSVEELRDRATVGAHDRPRPRRDVRVADDAADGGTHG